MDGRTVLRELRSQYRASIAAYAVKRKLYKSYTVDFIAHRKQHKSIEPLEWMDNSGWTLRRPRLLNGCLFCLLFLYSFFRVWQTRLPFSTFDRTLNFGFKKSHIDFCQYKIIILQFLAEIVQI